MACLINQDLLRVAHGICSVKQHLDSGCITNELCVNWLKTHQLEPSEQVARTWHCQHLSGVKHMPRSMAPLKLSQIMFKCLNYKYHLKKQRVKKGKKLQLCRSTQVVVVVAVTFSP